MKLTISQSDLAGAMAAIIGTVPANGTMQILSHVRIVADADSITLTASDLETEMTARVDASPITTGEACLPAKKLHDLARSAPKGASITIDCDQGRAKIKAGRSTYQVGTLLAEDFPDTAEESADQVEMAIDSADLARLLGSVSYAQGRDDVRRYLNGTLLDCSGGKIHAVATDGHRLASDWMRVQCDADQMQVILPRRSAAELCKLPAGEVSLIIGPRQLRAVTTGLTLVTKLIDGKYPDYRRVMPGDDFNAQAVLNRDALISALKRVLVLASSDKTFGVRLRIVPDRIDLEAANQDHETANDSIDADTSGQELVVVYNVRYLLDAVQSMTGESVTLNVIDPERPALMTDETNARHVLMPMKL